VIYYNFTVPKYARRKAKDMILVTGSTGLIGSHLILELLQKGLKVRALVRASSNKGQIRKVFGYYVPNPQTLFDRIEWYEGDMNDRYALEGALEGVGEVYHAAAFVSFSRKDKIKMLTYNIDGTALLVDLANAAGVKKFCFVSSTAALGVPDENGHVDEKSTWKSIKGKSVYAVSKFKSEMEVWRGMAEGLNAVIVNPSIVIGPSDWGRSSARLFDAIWKGLKFYTHGVTGYVDVHDVVASMVALMEKDISKEKFIVSEGNYSYHDIFGKIAAALGKRPPSIYASPWLTKLAYYGSAIVSLFSGRPSAITRETISAGRSKVYFSNEKIKQAIGINFKNIDRSIDETARCFLMEHQKS
jgi:dihydroflavonol-4-reductase